MIPHDRVRLRAESLEDRSVPSTGDVYSPAASSSLALDPDNGARPVTVRRSDGPYVEPECRDYSARAQGHVADVTITNRTWFTMKFTLSNGSFLGLYVLGPTESVSGRGLGGVHITFYDGRGSSSLSLESGVQYEFVERAGLFLLERAW